MAASPNKKGNGKKKLVELIVMEDYAVANGAFVENPEELLDELLMAQRFQHRAVLFKEDIMNLCRMRSEKAAKLITKIRKTEKGLAGRRFVTIREFIKYTRVPEEKVLRYLLGLTVYKRILS